MWLYYFWAGCTVNGTLKHIIALFTGGNYVYDINADDVFVHSYAILSTYIYELVKHAKRFAYWSHVSCGKRNMLPDI